MLASLLLQMIVEVINSSDYQVCTVQMLLNLDLQSLFNLDITYIDIDLIFTVEGYLMF
jgi:hypothetical protein